MPAKSVLKKGSAHPRASNSPSEVSPGIFVGGWKDAVAFTGAKFCVLDEAPDEVPDAKHVPIYDAEKDRPLVANLDKLAESIAAAHRRAEPVLVFCGHGVRRSPLAAAWYLHRVEKLSLDDAYARIRKARPKIEEAREWIGNVDELD
jgi:protein-tyrosine phosphatase